MRETIGTEGNDSEGNVAGQNEEEKKGKGEVVPLGLGDLEAFLKGVTRLAGLGRVVNGRGRAVVIVGVAGFLVVRLLLLLLIVVVIVVIVIGLVLGRVVPVGLAVALLL